MSEVDGVVRTIDMDNLNTEKVKRKYPYISVIPNDTTGAVAEALVDGDMQFSIKYKGERLLKSISMSVYNISKLLRTCDEIVFHLSEERQIEIKEMSDYVEGVNEWISLSS